jgi:hypothetical protein
MPWTFAHPAAVLPFRRICSKYLNFGALIIGSIAPDLGYYLGMYDLPKFGHTMLGSIVISFPASIILYIFYCWLRIPVLQLLPNPHRLALSNLTNNLRVLNHDALMTKLSSLLIGVWTHTLWDSFTHREGWIVQESTLLRYEVFRIGENQICIYYLLQHLSTLFGVVVLGIFYRNWLSASISKARPAEAATDSIGIDRVGEVRRYALICILLLISSAVAIPVTFSRIADMEGFVAFRVFIFQAAVLGTSTFLLLFVLCAVWLNCTRSDSNARPIDS